MDNKIRNSFYYLLRKIFLMLSIVSATSLAAALADATTYYISATGADSSSGTSSTSPWKTFGFAIPKLRAGDTLILRNGTYNASNTGNISINCGTNANSGTNGQPITLKAENERQAHISSNGSQSAFFMANCQWWIIEGLHISSADNPNFGSNSTDVLMLYKSANLIVRRNILDHNNRYDNAGMIVFYPPGEVGSSLVEENELYYYHRHGIGGGDNMIYRRNYCNSRGYPDLSGGRASYGDKGDSCIVIYPGSNNIVENNISENNINAFDVEADYGAVVGNKFLGNISLNDTRGYFSQCRASQPTNQVIKDFVVINSSAMGLYPRGELNLQLNNITILNSSGYGVLLSQDAGVPGCPPAGSPVSATAANILVSNSALGAFLSDKGITGSLDYTNAVQNNLKYSLSASVTNTHSTTSDPALGNCKVWIPDSSPMKGTGLNRADIGANILYRYQSGVLTTTPLWHPSTGEFPHGAIVPGLNDVAGSSAFDVNKRLNVNTNGCFFPAGYGGSSVAPPSGPTKLILTK